MKFIENIKSSIYNPAYYDEILNKPFSYSLRYFLSLAAVIALISTISFSILVLPEINKAVGEIAPNVLNYYPDNLEVTVKDGKVSTNAEEPFFIKAPAGLIEGNKELENKTSEEKIENLLVIDTASSLTIDAFKNYKTFVVLGRDSIAYRESNGAMKVQPITSGADGALDKTKFAIMLNKIMPYVKIIPFALAPIVFFFVFIGFIFGNLIYLIFGAAVIWLAAKIRNRKLEYGKAYQVGLHAITLGAIINVTVFSFLMSLEIPFLFTFIMVAIIWVNLKFAANTDVPVPESKSSI